VVYTFILILNAALLLLIRDSLKGFAFASETSIFGNLVAQFFALVFIVPLSYLLLKVFVYPSLKPSGSSQ
jgi:hypothetical protein